MKKVAFFISLALVLAPLSGLSFAEFDSNSTDITNPFFPFQNGDWFRYEGYGGMAGETETWEIVGVEVVDSIRCLKLAVGGSFAWLAQNTDGDVWFIKVVLNEGNTYTPGSGISNPLMRAQPQVGDRISSIFPESAGTYSEVTDVGVDVAINTGLGPFEDCIEITSYWNNEMEEMEYCCPGIGSVKREETPGTGMALSDYGNTDPDPDDPTPDPEPDPTPDPEPGPAPDPEPAPIPDPEPEPEPQPVPDGAGGDADSNDDTDGDNSGEAADSSGGGGGGCFLEGLAR